ncbi:hypothetical protein [Deinococcus sp. LM3]|uniref:RCC1 domain-containing protein n=1 Tax=Deinococcus sp. LM3 TaxID=1938608 RepID=UPI00099482D0|nr:hypothetical protein [Deinococcus sp. LM3]
MRRRIMSLLLPPLLLAACGQTPIALPGGTTPGASTPATPVQQALPGVFQIDFNAIGTATPTSRLSLQAGGLSAQGLVSAPDQFSFSPVAVQTFAVTATSTRHVRATYKVTNNSSETLRNPKFVAVVPQGSTTDSVFTKIRYFDGSDATTSTNQPSLSQGQIFDASTGAAIIDPKANTFLTGLDVSGVDTTGKGIKTLTQAGWWLTTPPAPGETTLMAPGDSSLITFGVNVPMTPQDSGGATRDPFSFSLNVTAVQDALPAVRLSSVVKQWNETSGTFQNYAIFPTRTFSDDSLVQPVTRSLPAYYDIDTLDGSTTSKILCGGDKQMSVTNISTPGFPNRWRVQLYAVGEHTLNVYAGSNCRGVPLLSQTVTSTETSGTILAGGNIHGLALEANGTVALWGNTSTRGYSLSPGSTSLDFYRDGFVSVAAGGKFDGSFKNYGIALRADGTVFGGGNIDTGAPASDPLASYFIGSQFIKRSDIVSIAAGASVNLSLKADGTVLMGDNIVSGLGGVTSIATGDTYNLALKADGTVWSWGAGSQLAMVSGLSEVKSISSGGSHNLALKADGTVWSWGANDSGQLGDGTGTFRTKPVMVSGLSGVTSIAAGGAHSLALKTDGTVWSWGAGDKGQLGDGNSTFNRRPVKVMGLSRVTSIAAGPEYSLAGRADGTVRGWGLNREGQLIYSFTANQPVPIKTEMANIAQPTPTP